MKINIKRFAFIKYTLTTLAFFLIKANAMGCDCVMYPVKHYVKQSKNIIVARVTEVVPLDSQLYTDNWRIVVEVTKVFKGNIKVKEQLIFIKNSNCGPRFTKNDEYLLFCYRKKRKYHVYDCSYSDRVSSDIIEKIEDELKDS
ncbi:hypothetical protein SAMN05216311_10537 [Chitinophaga sp. CF418]|nr:hypothetical protein SAMN05216311_10537 [Chitinophaga sp. CF418]